MEFTFETQYNAETMALMAKALRRTIRKKHNCRLRLFGWIAFVLGLLLAISNGLSFNVRSIFTLAAVLAILVALLFEDKINGYVAEKQLLPGTEKTTAVFSENGFTSVTNMEKSEWNYDKIMLIAETTDFFVFIFSANHAQLYDKRHLQGGTADDFRRFIEAVTGKQVLPLK